MLRYGLAALVIAGCSGGNEPSKPEQPPPAAPLPDAALVELQPSGVFDPLSGRHLDDDVPAIPTAVPAPRDPRDRNARAQRPIDLTLRSTPPGAMAAVDGVQVGPTPTYWSGDANGRVHEFTFVAPHYAVARYRFVPVTSGILFARLDSVAGEEGSGEPGPQPIPAAPVGLVPPAPVPTIVSPPPPPRPRPPVDAAVPDVDAAVAPAEPMPTAPPDASDGEISPNPFGPH